MFKKNSPSTLECFQNECDMNIRDMIDNVFNGVIGLSIVPLQVVEARELWIHLAFSGQASPENKSLLASILVAQLKTSLQSAKLELEANPDKDDLAALWENETANMERWQIFTTTYKCTRNFKQAYQIAFIDFEPQPLDCKTASDELLWKQKLKEQQQELLFGKRIKQKKKSAKRKIRSLGPMHQNILDKLADGNAHDVESLHRSVYGRTHMDTHARNNISRRISEIKQYWLETCEDKSIVRTRIDGEPCYQMLAGKG